MSFSPRRRAALAAFAAIILLGPALTGCFANPLDSIGQQIGDAVEGATGVDVERSDGAVPDSFPASVPLIEGAVISGGSATIEGETNWTVLVSSERSTTDVAVEIRDAFAAAGFTEAASTQVDGNATLLFTGDYSVMVTVTAKDAATEAMYVVTPVGS